MIEITTPVGRLVSGHPMVSNPVKDDVTKLPKIGADGQPRIDFYVGLAIPKGAETHWNQTVWGQAIYNEGLTGWPAGEYNAPAFAWKIIDGDSQIPNKKSKVPAQREGWPGHWILNCSNGFPISCFRRGNYDPLQQIQRKEEIKTGDYARLVISTKGNAPSISPGVYLNPSLFELYQAGVAILSENVPDAAAAFGAVAGVLPAGAMVDPNVPATTGGVVQPPAPGQIAPGQIAPAPEFLTPPPPPVDFNVNINGQIHSAATLKASGWTDEQVAMYPRV